MRLRMSGMALSDSSALPVDVISPSASPEAKSGWESYAKRQAKKHAHKQTRADAKLAAVIDHTLLKPSATAAEVRMPNLLIQFKFSLLINFAHLFVSAPRFLIIVILAHVADRALVQGGDHLWIRHCLCQRLSYTSSG
eukprot:SAG31_NODE_743_length_12418_cov_3.780908_12_plen_138_part_00